MIIPAMGGNISVTWRRMEDRNKIEYEVNCPKPILLTHLAVDGARKTEMNGKVTLVLVKAADGRWMAESTGMGGDPAVGSRSRATKVPPNTSGSVPPTRSRGSATPPQAGV
jgi:hypothetical protein